MVPRGESSVVILDPTASWQFPTPGQVARASMSPAAGQQKHVDRAVGGGGALQTISLGDPPGGSGGGRVWQLSGVLLDEGGAVLSPLSTWPLSTQPADHSVTRQS